MKFCTKSAEYSSKLTPGAQLGYFKGSGCMVEIGHKDIGSPNPNEKIRTVESQVGLCSDT